MTRFTEAIRCHQLDVTKELLDNGYNVNEFESICNGSPALDVVHTLGQTAFSEIERLEWLGLAKKIIEQSSELIINTPNCFGQTCIQRAIHLGDHDIILMVLDKSNAGVCGHRDDWGTSALSLLTSSNLVHKEVILNLMMNKEGFDATQRDTGHMNPMHNLNVLSARLRQASTGNFFIS